MHQRDRDRGHSGDDQHAHDDYQCLKGPHRVAAPAGPAVAGGGGLQKAMDEPEFLRVVAPAEAAGERADRFLAGAIGTLSRTRVKGLIEAGHVRRDGAVIGEPAEPVRAGAVYDVRPPAVVSAVPRAQAIPFEILYEDADLLVLDKPAGLVVHPAPGNEDGTLVNALLAHCGESLPGIGGERRPGIVH